MALFPWRILSCGHPADNLYYALDVAAFLSVMIAMPAESAVSEG